MPRPARDARRPQRQRRLENPLQIRAWVQDLDPSEIHRELLARLAALDDTIAPAREMILRVERLSIERVLRQLGLEGFIPKAMTLLDDPAGAPRFRAMIAVARYYMERPYKPRVYLPPIFVGGTPPAAPPGMVHVLDLTVDQIREAVAALRPSLQALEANIQALTQKSVADHEVLVLLG